MVIPRRKEVEDKVNRYNRNRIREVWELRGISQNELAESLYKTGAAVSDVERGRVKVSATHLAVIAGVLEKPIAYFFPPGFRGLRYGKDELTPDEQEILYFYRWLTDNPAIQKLAYDRLKEMADAVRETSAEETSREYEELAFEQLERKK